MGWNNLSHGKSGSPVESGIVVDGLDYSYPMGRRALCDISIRIPPGFTALVGENGAGKTSLMRVMASLLEADRGKVSVDGVAFSRRTRAQYRRHIGWMPQDIPVLSGFTVQEAVAYHAWLGGIPKNMVQARVEESLGQVHLTDLAHRHATTLSGGQLRRLGLAQALVRDADWLLLDEPTAGLDPRQKQSLVMLLQELKGHANCVISTHNFDYFDALYDNVVVLHAGRIAWEGTVNAYLGLAADSHSSPAFAAFDAILDGRVSPE